MLALAKESDPVSEPANDFVAELATRTGVPDDEVMMPPLASAEPAAP